MVSFMVTTIDNPFNPFTQYDEWVKFDRDSGYFTNEYLARIAKTSNELSEQEQNEAINDAVNEIVRVNPNGMYKRVRAPSDLESA